jgi:hypothetical protein
MKNSINNAAIIIGLISFIVLIIGATTENGSLTSLAGLGILTAASLKVGYYGVVLIGSKLFKS